MARGNEQAQQASKSGLGFSNTLQGNAGGIYGSLLPELQAEAANPQGFTAPTVAKMKTEDMQGAGGSNAGATGQGALLAARTKNAGAPAAAIQESARNASQQLSKANTGVDIANEELKQHQRQAGLSGLQGLYGTNVGGATNALGEVANNVNANTNAANASWDWAKYILDPAMQAAGGAAAGGAFSGGGGLPSGPTSMTAPVGYSPEYDQAMGIGFGQG